MTGTDEDAIRQLERERLRALVSADMDRAADLHAEDFQLINPAGRAYTKAEYLGDIASGEIDYRVWEPGEIAVLLQSDVAIVRYQAEMEICLAGKLRPRQRLWHTDTYVLRDGRWQVVWSHATRILQP
jgi:ketosteroid isomerase-like protein